MNTQPVHLRIEPNTKGRSVERDGKRAAIRSGGSAGSDIDSVTTACAAHRVQRVVGGTEINTDNCLTGRQTRNRNLTDARTGRERAEGDQIVGGIDSEYGSPRESRTGTTGGSCGTLNVIPGFLTRMNSTPPVRLDAANPQRRQAQLAGLLHSDAHHIERDVRKGVRGLQQGAKARDRAEAFVISGVAWCRLGGTCEETRVMPELAQAVAQSQHPNFRAAGRLA